MNDQLNFNFEWLILNDYIIHKKKIVPSTSFSSKTYNPIEYFSSPIGIETVEDIQLDSFVKSTHYLHTLFASIDISDDLQLLNFINNFGIPFIFNDNNTLVSIEKALKDETHLINRTAYLNQNQLTEIHFHTVGESIYLDHIKQEICRYRAYIELYIYLTTEKANILSTTTKYLLLSDKYNQLKVTETNKINQYFEDDIKVLKLKDRAKTLLEKGISSGLKGMNIIFISDWTEDGSIKGAQSKQFSSLLSVLYFILHQSILNNTHLMICHHSPCNNVFIKTDPKSIYCSKQCLSRSKSARLREKKRKESIRLREEGLSIEEIAKKLKVEKIRVDQWLRKSKENTGN